MLLLIAPALAGVHLSGLPAKSVVAVDASGASVPCSDDGRGDDDVPGDGVWACDVATVDHAIVDGISRVSSPTLDDTPGSPGQPRQALRAVSIAMDAPASEVTASGNVLTCRDDGVFPDAPGGTPTCGGVAATTQLQLTFQTATGPIEANWTLDPQSGIGHAVFDGAGLVVDTPTGTPEVHEHVDVQPDQPTGITQAEQPAQPSATTSTPTVEHDASAGAGSNGTSGSAWWALALAVLAGLVGVVLGRRMPRGLPAGLEWGHGAQRVAVEESSDSLDDVVLARSRRGPVIVVGPVEPPPGEPGPVLRCPSLDVLDIADATAALVRAHGLSAITLVVPDPSALVSPGEVGLAPLERLRGELPPGTTAVLLGGTEEAT
ncbi:MAG: hypothetical protein GY913_01895 [Proteobacteria bacterium]|nr:hypothetical protein [Pseudomonadota bacterium]MCP4915653.1 hypothetical protein [Pseudomonadota bacterium]